MNKKLVFVFFMTFLISKNIIAEYEKHTSGHDRHAIQPVKNY